MRPTLAILFWMSILIFAPYSCNAEPNFITNPDRNDGFGAQFQTIIQTVIYAELHDMEFLYTPFNHVEHNYDNNPSFIQNKEWLINFMENFPLNVNNCSRTGIMEVINFFDHNVERCSETQSLKKIKQIFRSNKKFEYYFDHEQMNIAIHIRRPNPHDNRLNGANTPDAVFLDIIEKLRVRYSSQKPKFHLFSQSCYGNSFECFKAADVILHVNESIEDTFTSLVLADVLVTSPSSFSYSAALVSEGTVYYIPFWHSPLPHWQSIHTL